MFSMLWIYTLPEWVFGLLCCSVFVLIGILGYFLTRPVVRLLIGPPAGHNKGVDAVIGAVTLLYGLVLALLAVAVWQQFVAAQNIVASEAAALRSVYRDVDSYDEPARTVLTDQLRDYTRIVIDVEWPEQQRGIVPTGGIDKLAEFEKSLYSFEPRSERVRLVDQSAITEFNKMIEFRVMRLNTVASGIPATLWAVLLIGALITTLTTYFLQLEPVRTQLTMTSLVTLLVGLVVFMTAVVDHPFRGTRGMSVTPEAFQLVYDRTMTPSVR